MEYKLNIGSKGIELIKKYEGCRLQAYKCPGDVWTIGWGHTVGVYEGQVITQEEADRLFLEDVKIYADAVEKYQKIFNFTQTQFDVLTSFAYNCGVGSLANVMACCNTKQEIAEECKLYNKSNGKVLAGLVKRREEEYKIFIADIENINIDTYKVKIGDTLSAIASKYNTTVDKLVSINNISNPNKIYVGQVLKITGKVDNTIYHTVVAGEFLGIIASRYGVTVASICKLNKISDPDLIYAGQKLKIK